MNSEPTNRGERTYPMNVLGVYVNKQCFGCDEALRLAKEISQSRPPLEVKVRIPDEMTESHSPEIIATPSYFLNGRRIFIGDARLEEPVARITWRSNEEGRNYE